MISVIWKRQLLSSVGILYQWTGTIKSGVSKSAGQVQSKSKSSCHEHKPYMTGAEIIQLYGGCCGWWQGGGCWVIVVVGMGGAGYGEWWVIVVGVMVVVIE